MRLLSVLFGLVVLSLNVGYVDAATGLPTAQKLTWHYYKVHHTCDDAESYIKHQVELLWKKDNTIAPKLLRLLYSDCFVTVSTLFINSLATYSFLVSSNFNLHVF